LFLNRFDFDLSPLVSIQKKFLPPFERCEDAVVFFVSCWKSQEEDDDERMDVEIVKKDEDGDGDLIRMKNQQMFMKNLTFFKEMIKPKLNDPLTNSWASLIVKSLEKVVKENGVVIGTKELDQDFKMEESINAIPMSSLFFCQIECCFEIIVNQFSTKLVSFLFSFFLLIIIQTKNNNIKIIKSQIEIEIGIQESTKEKNKDKDLEKILNECRPLSTILQLYSLEFPHHISPFLKQLYVANILPESCLNISLFPYSISPFLRLIFSELIPNWLIRSCEICIEQFILDYERPGKKSFQNMTFDTLDISALASQKNCSHFLLLSSKEKIFILHEITELFCNSSPRFHLRIVLSLCLITSYYLDIIKKSTTPLSQDNRQEISVLINSWLLCFSTSSVWSSQIISPCYPQLNLPDSTGVGYKRRTPRKERVPPSICSLILYLFIFSSRFTTLIVNRTLQQSTVKSLNRIKKLKYEELHQLLIEKVVTIIETIEF